MLVEICLLGLKNCNGRLSLLVLSFLGHVILSHLFFRSLNIFDQGLTDVSGLLSKVLLKLLLLTTKSLDLSAIEVEFFSQGLGGLLKSGNFTFKSSIELAGVGCRRHLSYCKFYFFI